jgi:hypothetical protein
MLSPLIAVCLTQYLQTQEKHQTTFALPIPETYAERQEVQQPESLAESPTAKDSPADHAPLGQAFPLKSEKQVQARNLIEKAGETKGDPAGRFALLRLAKDVATQAGDEQTAFQAIDALAEKSQIDPNAMKMAVLAKFASAAQKPAQHKTIAEEALKLVDEAVRQDRFMVASQLGKLALAEAKRSPDRELVAHAQGQMAEVAELVKARERAAK